MAEDDKQPEENAYIVDEKGLNAAVAAVAGVLPLGGREEQNADERWVAKRRKHVEALARTCVEAALIAYVRDGESGKVMELLVARSDAAHRLRSIPVADPSYGEARRTLKQADAAIFAMADSLRARLPGGVPDDDDDD